MSTANLIRWSGLISLLAGVLYALATFVHPFGEDFAAVMRPNWVPAHLLYWVSVILMQFGLVGLYLCQAEKAGRLGLVSFILAFIGTALLGSLNFMASTLQPLIASAAPAIFDQAMAPTPLAGLVIVLGFGLGYILFGVVTMRAGVLPRWAGFLLIIGVVLLITGALLFSILIVDIGDIIFSLGLAWMGYALWSKKPEQTLTAMAAG